MLLCTRRCMCVYIHAREREACEQSNACVHKGIGKRRRIVVPVCLCICTHLHIFVSSMRRVYGIDQSSSHPLYEMLRFGPERQGATRSISRVLLDAAISSFGFCRKQLPDRRAECHLGFVQFSQEVPVVEEAPESGSQRRRSSLIFVHLASD